MAKDVIQITDKETGETGNVRDSRLALAKEKTAVALTDAIELRTIDDKQIFVKADSFFNAFAQWCKANNKSTITSLFGELTADGVSSPGSINMANLASVLSVHSTTDGPSSVLSNSIKSTIKNQGAMTSTIHFSGSNEEGGFWIQKQSNGNASVLFMRSSGPYASIYIGTYNGSADTLSWRYI